MTTAAPPFDLSAPLPSSSTTLIEASAGTGKTFTLSSLAVRYVAEMGVPIDQILLVTFTRAATAELRARIRQRLIAAVDHLAEGPAADHPDQPDPDDPVPAVLAACDDSERARRIDRLRAAVADYDTASISTIHGFCAQVRGALGVLSRADAEAAVVGSDAELIAEVCADLYFGELTGRKDNPLGDLKLDALITRVTKARTMTGCLVDAETGDIFDLRAAELVRAAVAEVDERLLRRGALSYDSLLTSVRDAIGRDPALVTALRSQYRVAMIDEFQDTDPVQWEIFRALFGGSEADRPTLILVGDPKQAIYGFRGGDVYTYLAARESAELRALTVNQRSDRRVIEAMNGLACGDFYGETDIAYHRVEVATRHEGRRVVAGDGSTAPGLEVRMLTDAEVLGRDELESGPVRRAIGCDLAAVAHRLISGARIHEPGRDPCPVEPGDIAVLVGSTADAAPMASALREAGIPCVLRLRDDVADSPAAQQWRTLLHALDRPASTARATAAALSWFFGWNPAQLATAMSPTAATGAESQDTALLDLQVELGRWSDVLAQGGMPALYGEVRRSHDLVARLLRSHQGERNLTDLEHLAELIHTGLATRAGTTAASALTVLDGLGGTPEDEVAAEIAQRRIDSDAAAVQIATIHGAKGLEFPFVLLPTLWSGGHRVQGRAPYCYYDRDRDTDGGTRGTRVLDVSTRRDGYTKSGQPKTFTGAEAAPGASGETKRQNCGDQHRLTYVALTRALHQTVVWWCATARSGTALTGLNRFLFGPGEAEPGQKVEAPNPVELVTGRRDRLGLDDAVAVEEMTEIPDPAKLPPIGSPGPDTPHALDHARLGRTLRRTGKVWSFSSLKKVGEDHGTAGESESTRSDPTEVAGDDRGAADEFEPDEPIGDGSDDDAPAGGRPADPTSGSDPWTRPSPFDGLTGGKRFGTLVHDLFEKVDLASDDPRAAFAARLEESHPSELDGASRSRLAGALDLVVSTPLGPDLGGIRLRDLDPGDHLDELTFHLPLAPGHPVAASRVGEVIADHLPPDDPFGSWARNLARGLTGTPLQGFLTGSIDLTLRFTVGGRTRYSIVDYKTNTLSPAGTPGQLGHYRRDRMIREMTEGDYVLQALVYSVALHRYLRWRVPDYSPDIHLGPVGYLFVRGMAGPDTPLDGGVPAGVFTWSPPPGLVDAVSRLFAGDGGGGSR